MSWYNSGSWIKVHSYRAHSKCPLVGYQCLIEKKKLSFLPCRGHKRIPGQQTTAANRPNQTDFRCFRFQFFLSVHCVLPFVSTQCFLSVHCLLHPPSFRFASSFPRVTSALSFHVLYSVRYFFTFVSTLRFRSLRLSFRVTFSLLCVTSVRSFQVLYPVRFFFPFVSTLPCRLLRPSFWFNSSCVVSTFPFCSLRPFFHFKSPLPLVTSFLSY